MLFNIEHDGGDCIIGYVVPDGYSERAKLKVTADNGRISFELTTSDPRPALVSAGRHETGRCGFTINDDLVPGIENIADLEVLEIESNLLIYRRPRPDFIKKKILRIDTHLFPLRKLDLSLGRFFQYHASRIERFGKETMDQLFLLNRIDSIFLAGRLMYKNYQHYIEGGFSTFVVLQDPHEELAERILTLKILGENDKRLLSSREEVLFSSVISYVKNLSLMDMSALKRGILNMPKDVVAILSNPVVRQLTAAAVDEMPQRYSVASALDVLSSCELIGFRSNPRMISGVIADILKLSSAEIDVQDQPSSVRQLGAMLKETGAVDSFLEKDIELYHNVLDAAKAAGKRSGNFNDEQ